MVVLRSLTLWVIQSMQNQWKENMYMLDINLAVLYCRHSRNINIEQVVTTTLHRDNVNKSQSVEALISPLLFFLPGSRMDRRRLCTDTHRLSYCLKWPLPRSLVSTEAWSLQGSQISSLIQHIIMQVGCWIISTLDTKSCFSDITSYSQYRS